MAKFSRANKIKLLLTTPLILLGLYIPIRDNTPVKLLPKQNSLPQISTITKAQSTESLALIDEFEMEDFSISIPSIGLLHPIKYNVDPRHKTEYLPILEEYIAHGKFTALPSTGDGRVYLFAHSKVAPEGVTPKGGYFSHIHELNKGDNIEITFNQDTYIYSVRKSIIVDASAVDYYTGESDRSEVALQACYPPGTTEKRIIVFADLISVN